MPFVFHRPCQTWFIDFEKEVHDRTFALGRQILCKTNAHKTGTTVMAERTPPRRWKFMFMARGRNSFPSTRSNVKIGRNVTTIIEVANIIGLATSEAGTIDGKHHLVLSSLCPCVLSQFGQCRMMFSTMMIEASTMMPKSIAPSDSRFAGMLNSSRESSPRTAT